MFLDVRSRARYLVASPGLVRLVDCQLKGIILIRIDLLLTPALECRMKNTGIQQGVHVYVCFVPQPLKWTLKRQSEVELDLL